MIDSQTGEVKFGQRSKVGSKHVNVPFFIKYKPTLKKMAQILKKLGTYYIRMNLLSEYLLLISWFPTAVQENQVAIWFVLCFTFWKKNFL